MSERSAEKKVKAWAIVVGENLVSDGLAGDSSLAIYKTRERARMNTLSHKIIPVTITYTLSTKKKKACQ